MTFAQLRTFLAVARTGSVRAAAADLVVTEPAVSAAVAALGRELGCELLARDGRGIRLTEAGRTMAAYAAELVGLAEQARREVAGGSRLRLAGVTTAGEFVLPGLIKAFRERHPEVDVSLEVGNREEVLAALRRRDVDLAVGGRPPDTRDISGTAFRDYRLVVVGSPGPRLRDLDHETWLLRERGSGTREAAERYLAEAHIAPRATMTIGSNGAVKQATAAGLGVTLLADDAVRAELAAGALVELRAPRAPLKRSWYVLTPARGPDPVAAELFRRLCLASPE
jgi:LysR family transcriptional regulator, low CO2-responsive transcriptional regulator